MCMYVCVHGREREVLSSFEEFCDLGFFTFFLHVVDGCGDDVEFSMVCACERDLHLCKRDLCLCKRAQHLRKRDLHVVDGVVMMLSFPWCVRVKEPYISAKEPYISANETNIFAKEPNISAKLNCLNL